jgi:hypothetical protein
MKKILLKIMAAVILVCIFGPGELTTARANPRADADNDGCDLMEPDHGNVTYGKNEELRAVSVTVDTIEPKHVVIIGQDEKKKGVSFHIKVESLPGKISYMTPRQLVYRSLGGIGPGVFRADTAATGIAGSRQSKR